MTLDSGAYTVTVPDAIIVGEATYNYSGYEVA